MSGPARGEPASGETDGSGAPSGVGPEWLKLSASDLLDAAQDALRGVYDPELYLDVVSLGLVYDVRDENGAVVVEMTMTTPGCPASEVLPEMARAAIADAVGGSVEVDVRVVWDPPWSPAMIDEDAARSLGFRAR
ncbi:MAG: metal-sulfur cluster assembly factor [Actinomycetes bacterium]